MRQSAFADFLRERLGARLSIDDLTSPRVSLPPKPSTATDRE
ncbi:hypothetical protein [Gordonia metallireducens]|nr:hypothetical protein [Gordonia metallireducens]